MLLFVFTMVKYLFPSYCSSTSFLGLQTVTEDWRVNKEEKINYSQVPQLKVPGDFLFCVYIYHYKKVRFILLPLFISFLRRSKWGVSTERLWAIIQFVIWEKFAVNVEVGKNNASGIKGRENLDTTKPNYCDLYCNWTIVFTEWFVMNYFGSSYGHF